MSMYYQCLHHFEILAEFLAQACSTTSLPIIYIRVGAKSLEGTTFLYIIFLWHKSVIKPPSIIPSSSPPLALRIPIRKYPNK